MSLLPLPKPIDILPPDIVREKRILIEYHELVVYNNSPEDTCGYLADVIAYCTEKTCIFWLYNPHGPANHRKLLKFLLLIDEYYDLALRVMNYDEDTITPIKTFTGADGITRKRVTEINVELCHGAAGVSFNGQLWAATTKALYNISNETINLVRPTIHQIYFYEIGRATFNLALDNIIEWQMQNEGEYGYWALGFNGAMTVLAPERMGVEMDYHGQDTATFRQNRLNDLATYVDNPAYNFNNTWSSFLLPWNSNQSINDVMSGLLIYLADNYGGLKYLERLFFRVLQQPPTPSRTDRQQRANNFFRGAHRAALDLYGTPVADEIFYYFSGTLKWPFVSG